MGIAAKILIRGLLLLNAIDLTLARPSLSLKVAEDSPLQEIHKANKRALKVNKVPTVPQFDNGKNETAKNHVISYLSRFGYLNSTAPINADSAEFTSALSKLQGFGNVPKSGKYDEVTAALLQKPRCGLPDIEPTRGGISPRYVLDGRKWSYTDLTYRFDSFTPDITQAQSRTALVNSFAQWSSVSRPTFREVAAGQPADIIIGWFTGDHGDGSPFDGPGTILAHGFYPPENGGALAGDIHFDEDETWTPAFLNAVALHEIGHAIGLQHSALNSAVMWPFNNGLTALTADDISGVQAIYGGPRGWQSFTLAAGRATANGRGITALSRIPSSMEVFWVGDQGEVKDAYYYDGPGWRQFNLAAAGSATPGSITSISRKSNTMAVFWTSPSGSVEAAQFYDGTGWSRFQIAPAGSAALGSKLTAVSRISSSIELWWIAPDGSVQDAYWYEGAPWKRFALAPAGSAAPGGIASTARIPGSMEIWWTSPQGSIEGAFWYETTLRWVRYQVAPANSAVKGSRITALARLSNTMEIWWIAPDGSVQDAYWYEGSTWKRFALAPAGSSALNGGIKAVSRQSSSMEVWWTGPQGSIEGAFFNNNPWTRFRLAPTGSILVGSDIAGTSRNSLTMELWHAAPSASLTDRYIYI